MSSQAWTKLGSSPTPASSRRTAKRTAHSGGPAPLLNDGKEEPGSTSLNEQRAFSRRHPTSEGGSSGETRGRRTTKGLLSTNPRTLCTTGESINGEIRASTPSTGTEELYLLSTRRAVKMARFD